MNDLKKDKKNSNRNPKGAGLFAIIFGIVFLSLFICSFIWDLSSIPPYLLFKIWLIFAAIILIGWGVTRLIKLKSKWRISRPTIQFLISIIGITIAILTLIIATK